MADIERRIKRDLKELGKHVDDCNRSACKDSPLEKAVSDIRNGTKHPYPDASNASRPCAPYANSTKPLNRAELGRASWALLHTTAAFFPDKPPKAAQEEMRRLMYLALRHYPCGYCADMSMAELARNPPRAGSRAQLSRWLCEVHNEVNERLGKPAFPCELASLDARWRGKK